MAAKSWLCVVCGYVHEGDQPAGTCPICGATEEHFEEVETSQNQAEPAQPEQWRCINCEYIHDGNHPPEVCPICAVGPDRFEAVFQDSSESSSNAVTGTIVIIGGGIAGLSAAESARSTAPEATIILLTREDELPYYRLNLTRYLAGELSVEALPVHPESWYRENRIDIRFATEVTAISPERKEIAVKEGAPLAYDRLVLAMGAHPFVPPIPGVNRQHIVTLRTRKDADRILRTNGAGSRCVVVGGGVLGLETAAALARRQAHVTLLEGFSWLLPRQLNAKASSFLAKSAQEQGINLVADAKIKQFDGDEVVRSVVLESGEVIPADLVIITAGVRTNSYLPRLAGLKVKEGVVVDSSLQTTCENIYAAGDLAEYQSIAYGTWGPAQFQGAIAGMNAAGGTSQFGGIPRSHILKVLGVDMISMGQIQATDASYKTYEIMTAERYGLLVFRDDRLQGSILVGDTSLASKLKKLMESGTNCHDYLSQAATDEEVFKTLAA